MCEQQGLWDLKTSWHVHRRMGTRDSHAHAELRHPQLRFSAAVPLIVLSTWCTHPSVCMGTKALNVYACAQAQELLEFQALEREACSAAPDAQSRSEPYALPAHLSPAPDEPAAQPRMAEPAAGSRARMGESRAAHAESPAEHGLRMAREVAGRGSVGGRSGERRVSSPKPSSAGRGGATQPRPGALPAAQGSLLGDVPKAQAQGPQGSGSANPTGSSAADAAVRLAEERARLAGLRGQLEAALARLDADKVAFERRKVHLVPLSCAA